MLQGQELQSGEEISVATIAMDVFKKSQFPVPKSQTDVRSFCGLANQMCNFSDEISSLLSPLKSLLKKGIKFDWLPEFQTAFETAKRHLSSEKVLNKISKKWTRK
jgi:hypothetical protein